VLRGGKGFQGRLPKECLGRGERKKRPVFNLQYKVVGNRKERKKEERGEEEGGKRGIRSVSFPAVPEEGRKRTGRGKGGGGERRRHSLYINLACKEKWNPEREERGEKHS